MRAKGTATFNSLDQQILGQRRFNARHVSVKPDAKRPAKERAAPVPVSPTPCMA
jgi:hypothetical protein